ncbi:MAG TPA: permease [Enhygromyxa sp.]|nr:permease [Enhygromyxa sp.]
MFTAIADLIVYRLLGLGSGRLAETLHFFVYDFVQIVALLFLLAMVVGLATTFIPKQRSNELLANVSGGRKLVRHVLAALLGAVTPFCSCSSIPLFIGLARAGVPLGVNLTFLVTSPLINEVAVVLIWVSFGWQVALMYVALGLAVGLITGLTLGAFELERFMVDTAGQKQIWRLDIGDGGWRDRLRFAWSKASKLTVGTLPYILVGVAIGSLIHGYTPDGLLEGLFAEGSLWSVPVAAIAGVPLYGGAAATIPVMQSLVAKGVPLGTALAFMMSIVALSLPEAILLKKVMQTRLIVVFFATVTACIIAIGLLLNLAFG